MSLGAPRISASYPGATLCSETATQSHLHLQVNVLTSKRNKLPLPESPAPFIILLSPEMLAHVRVTPPWTRRDVSLCKNPSAIWHCDSLAGSRWAAAQRVRNCLDGLSSGAVSLSVTYRRPSAENGPFFTSNCIHYVVLGKGRILGMKITTIQTKRHEILLGSGSAGDTVGAIVP